MRAALILAVMVSASGWLIACSRGSESPAPAVHNSEIVPPGAARLLAELPEPYDRGDIDNGRLHFSLCRSCHTIAAGGPDMTGPNLHGVFGRRVASKSGYDYSAALRARAWTWDAPHLNDWLRDPRAYAPGTKMTFYGLHDDKDRIDTIAYLKVVSAGGPM